MPRAISGVARWSGLCLWLVVLGCGPAGDPHSSALPAPASSQAPIAGSEPKRIVSLAPNFTEIVYALGAEDSLVGVTPYCRFPPEARQKPRVGALVGTDYEKLLSLNPDLVILLPGHADVARELNRLSIRTITIRTESIADILAAIETLGATLGRSDEAAALVADIEQVFEAIRLEAARRSAQSKPRVLFVIGRNPATLQQIYTCGSDSYLNELIELVGAVGAIEESSLPWPVIGKETILKIDPDVILDGSIRQGDAPVEGDVHMEAWNQLDVLSAVRNGRVVAVTDEHIMIPGPWIAEAARALSGWIFDSSNDE